MRYHTRFFTIQFWCWITVTYSFTIIFSKNRMTTVHAKYFTQALFKCYSYSSNCIHQYLNHNNEQSNKNRLSHFDHFSLLDFLLSPVDHDLSNLWFYYFSTLSASCVPLMYCTQQLTLILFVDVIVLLTFLLIFQSW